MTCICVRSKKCVFSFYLPDTHLQQNNPRLPREDKWVWVEENVTLFSAFYDDRAFRPKPVVVVLGLERQSNLSTRYKCLLLYRDGRKLLTDHAAPLKVLVRDNWFQYGTKILNHRPFSHICNLPSPEIPQLVSITSEQHSSNSIVSKKFVVITNRKESVQKSFGVCVSAPIYKMDNPQMLIDIFEINKLLGSEFFTVYVYQLSWKSRTILEKYTKDGVAEMVRNWGDNFPGVSHYYGQQLSVTDCLYRNIYRVKYLVYTDLDEIIVPLKQPNWGSLMRQLDGPTKGSFVFNMVYLRPVEQPLTSAQKVKCPSGAEMILTSSRFATFRSRSSAAGSSKARTKYIIKTNVTLVAQIHRVEELVPGYVTVKTPVDTGLVYHYRAPYSSNGENDTWAIDTVVVKYLGRLLTAVKDVLCSISQN